MARGYIDITMYCQFALAYKNIFWRIESLMKKNNKKGFTLVELVIVVAVMAILVAVAIPTVKSITGTAKKATYDTNCRTIESVLKLYEAEKSNSASETAGAAATYTMTGPDVRAALDAAKLGITGDATSGTTFYYHTATGIVNDSATAGTGDTVITITYDASGAVTAPAAG